MTTKVQGTQGIEFPDGTVQSSAAYSKAEANANVASLFSNITLFLAGQGRALATTYTNTSGKPMFVNATVDVTSAASISADVNGKTVLGNNSTVASGFVNVSFIVPAGGTYSVTTSAAAGSIFYWTEMK